MVIYEAQHIIFANMYGMVIFTGFLESVISIQIDGARCIPVLMECYTALIHKRFH